MNNIPQHNEPTYTLEIRAADQRRRLHSSVVELRSRVQEKMNPKQVAREYLVAASGVAALLGLVLGYGLTGVFTRKRSSEFD
jgi:hypothetical protein